MYNFVFSVLLILSSSPSVVGAALSHPFTLPSILQYSNASSPESLTVPILSRPDRCTAKDEWFSPRFVENDCKSALLYFWITEFENATSEEQEFLARGGRKRQHYTVQQTPRKYIFGTTVYHARCIGSDHTMI